MTTPAGSAKILLKIVADQGGQEASHTYAFVSKDNALQDREAFKGELTQAISRSRAKDKGSPSTPQDSGTSSPVAGANQEFELRKKLLMSNAELAQLHRELVFSNQLSEEEFWQGREQMLRNQSMQDTQQKGRSSAIVDPRPMSGESGDVKITITPQLIHDLFEQYPVVQKAYSENVPENLSETEFWRRYFSSELFNQTRGSARAARVPKDDIFDAYLEEEDDEIEPKRLKIGHIHRLLDLAATEEDHGESGNRPDFTMRAGQNKKSLPLMRQFNQHSERLLKATTGEQAQDRDTDYLKDIIMEDLEADEQSPRIYLDIQDQNRYFESQQSGEANMDIDGGKDPAAILQETRAHFMNYHPDLLKNGLLSKVVVSKVSQGLNASVKAKAAARTYVMKGGDIVSGLPDEIFSQMVSCHAATNEFLRHFWLSTANGETARTEKMVVYLEKTKKRVDDIANAAAQGDNAEQQAVSVRSMLSPMMVAVNKALKVFRGEGRAKVGDKRPRP